MLVVLSPAKTLDYESPLPVKKSTQPRLLEQSQQLVKVARKYSSEDLRGLMKVSENIADLNVQRFKAWDLPFTADNARPAAYAFKGDVYAGLQAYSMSARDIEYAQQHLRILSGLYGLLRPLDLMQPYRLEMGVKLSNSRGKNLYEFWGDRITEILNGDIKRHKVKILINLASNEYFKSVKQKQLDMDVITPQFLDWKNGDYKMISFFAKKARGAMARFIMQERVGEATGLRSFDWEGYQYNASLSQGNEWVFSRH